jgi:hypothetical protein
MTDIDPLHKPPAEGSELPSRVARDQGGDRPRAGKPVMDGPTGSAMSTESVGDPDRHTITSGGEAGAGAGALAGAAVAGPIGLPIGAAAGAVVGAAAEAADVDKDTNEAQPMAEPGSASTGLTDPGTDPPAARGMAEERREPGSDRS